MASNTEQLQATAEDLHAACDAIATLPTSTQIRLSKTEDLLLLTWRTQGQQHGITVREGHVVHNGP